MLSALLTADRALGAASGEAALVDAEATGRALEEAVTAQIDMLGTFRAAFLAPGPERDRQLDALIDDYTDRPGAIRDLWIADSTGKTIYQSPSAAPRPTLSLTSAPQLSVEHDRRSRLLTITVP